MPTFLILLVLFSNLRECIGVVLRGARAQEGQFPWLIQFHTIIPCGGVLVSADWVLTAAQCVQFDRTSIMVYATGLNGTGSNQTVSVKATFIFPQFQAYANPRDHDHNIALMKLVRAFDVCNDKVRLLDIAPVRLDNDYKSCLIFGWQSTVAHSFKVHAKPIRYSKVLLNSWRFCMYMHEGNTSYKNVFCTMIEDEHGIRACAGNPGSPVVCEDQYQRMTLLGIASWSNFALDCGGLPTYLGVSVFGSWMWDVIFRNKNMERGLTRSDNLQPRKDNEDAEAYEISWKPSVGRSETNLNNLTNAVSSGRAKIQKLRSKLEPPVFDEVDDYTRVIGPEGSPGISHIDITRERDEKLSEYREIGQHPIDDHDEPTAVSPQQKKHIISDKLRNAFVKPEHEIFDDAELIIEDFDRSAASTCIVCCKILLLSFCNTLYTII